MVLIELELLSFNHQKLVEKHRKNNRILKRMEKEGKLRIAYQAVSTKVESTDQNMEVIGN